MLQCGTMKRRWRWLYLACLAICGLLALLWIRSIWAEDTWEWSGPNSVVGFSSSHGRVIAFYGQRYMANLEGDGFVHFSEDSGWVRPFDRLYDPDEYFLQAENAWGANYYYISDKTWNAFAIFFLLLIRKPLASAELSLRARWREARDGKTAGRCRKCGYDLRATPHRCPECGTIPQSTATK
jgi:hypothetical protein